MNTVDCISDSSKAIQFVQTAKNAGEQVIIVNLVDPAQVTVRRDTLEHFSSGRSIEIRKYSLKEKLTKRPTGKVLQTARDALGEKGYNILCNNCEHFVNRCVFGKAFSTQIDEMRANLDVD